MSHQDAEKNKRLHETIRSLPPEQIIEIDEDGKVHGDISGLKPAEEVPDYVKALEEGLDEQAAAASGGALSAEQVRLALEAETAYISSKSQQQRIADRLNALLAAHDQKVREQVLAESLAIYEKAFEQNCEGEGDESMSELIKGGDYVQHENGQYAGEVQRIGGAFVLLEGSLQRHKLTRLKVVPRPAEPSIKRAEEEHKP